MTTDFRALCAELLMALENAISIIIIYREDGTKHISTAEQVVNRARAALADEPAVPQGREPATWTEGVCGDGAALLKDGVMVPIEAVVRELNEGARARAVLARWGNPALSPVDGEVAELTGQLIEAANGAAAMGWDQHAQRILRAAELLQRQALVPVAVSERPWERKGWCDPGGLCWLGSDAIDGCTPTWLYGPPAWAERFPNVHRVLLPAHALPLPEVGE